MHPITNSIHRSRDAFNQFNNRLRQPKTHPQPISCEYSIEIPNHQKVLSAYCTSLNIIQTKTSIISVPSPPRSDTFERWILDQPPKKIKPHQKN